MNMLSDATCNQSKKKSSFSYMTSFKENDTNLITGALKTSLCLLFDFFISYAYEIGSVNKLLCKNKNINSRK